MDPDIGTDIGADMNQAGGSADIGPNMEVVWFCKII